MLKKLSFRTKLFIPIMLVVVITYSCAIILVSNQSAETAKEAAFMLADEISAKYSYEIKAELQGARVSSESLMIVFKTLIKNGTADRETLNDVLRNALLEKQYIISFCVAFEPNKLDGKDALYAGQFPYYDKTGRYAPYWSLHNGKIGVEPLTGFDSDDWYAGARDARSEYITDPFFYEVQGVPVLMSSFVFPIIIDGEFYGIVSSDMALGSVQEMTSKVNTRGLDEYSEIYSNSGFIVAHPEKEYFNKTVYTVAAYHMLKEEPGNAPAALDVVAGYLKGLSRDTEAGAAEYKQATAFVQSLARYADNPSGASLDITLLTDGLSMELLKLNAERLNVATEVAEAIREGRPYTVVEDGYYTVYTPVKFSDVTNPWSIAVNVPISTVEERSEGIRLTAIRISALSLALIVAVLYFVTQNLSKPVLRLAGYAERISKGNYAIDIPDSRRNDEVGTLTKAFRTMMQEITDLIHRLTQKSEELKKKNAELIKFNALLENKVAERTQQLDEQVAVAKAANSAKSRFLTTTSHELRTPLTAILGISDILLLNKSLDKETLDAVNKIHMSGHSLLDIINDILDLAKIETGKLTIAPQVYNVPSLINDTVHMNVYRIGSKPIQFKLNVEESIPSLLLGDELRIKQVLNNVLSNSFKYTAEGTVTLDISHTRAGDQVTLVFVVTDTGQGMSPEDVSQSFTEFTRFNRDANSNVEGAGLGLSIVKRLLDIMGGTIHIDSELGKGSTFTITLVQQYVEGDVIGKDVAASLCDFRFSRKHHDSTTTFMREPMPYGKVLVVDDMETNLYVAKSVLLRYGLTVETASSGHEVLKKVSGGSLYDIIFLDHMMPGMDGVETAQKVRAFGYTGTIIALTANAVLGSEQMFRKNGFDDFISKPMNLQLLNDKLNTFVRDRHKDEAEALRKSGDDAGAVFEEPAIDPKLIEVFKRDARKAVTTLKTVTVEDRKLLITTIHAMRSALANIGEKEKSDFARSLEIAAIRSNDEDKAYFKNNMGRLIDMLDTMAAREDAGEKESPDAAHDAENT
ncbi:response regulator [Desulfovibrio sp. OttesenSCG-928-G15]|nr:response regulator [Desulfovibrio sp. OttesenSCG-928-G15]